MSRLIDADALKNAFSNMYREDYERWIKEVIDNAPTIEPFEKIGAICNENCGGYRPKGKWRSVGFEKGYAFCICSNCGNTTRLYRDSKNEFCCLADIREKAVACLYCGADMRSVDEGLHERAISDLSKAVDDAYKKARGDV